MCVRASRTYFESRKISRRDYRFFRYLTSKHHLQGERGKGTERGGREKETERGERREKSRERWSRGGKREKERENENCEEDKILITQHIHFSHYVPF
jgi:hypothetical protein